MIGGEKCPAKGQPFDYFFTFYLIRHNKTFKFEQFGQTGL